LGCFLTIAAKRAMEARSRVAPAPSTRAIIDQEKINACFNISDGFIDADHSPNMA
jgi:hypothetical protein